ncbi:sensor histidine kinase [Rathayibacter iranicus]|uniref:Signal transduction histidine kinase subgroup 3 dimerisation and phosphoacceptor domain-containing protein n=2 Tax=Rathayibacter iranicus TaxID=59737 RepID=A0AAD1ELX0_9MICO|nr:histidine kinase [Rathayibacter iranicus]AZZ55140.1 hypothetical protein C7V51_04000 [Rathayibacter iranicus]MWV32373.1 hypothetical protein [Rathayibacter iranicus NCPPB 2253 = VKM Ac-1602]PPI49454.1 hypothetical protein C5E09_03070 [Rathayibacter iranicus]PPI61819.1 hypothetical protein C5E08_03985 [Rathayibacter iranicus]PPI73394.1 hypothetical protein C5E01_03050 [Rathayibacter iranicus]
MHEPEATPAVWWRRLSTESRVSVVGSVLIAVFLLIVSITIATKPSNDRAPTSVAVQLGLIVLVAVMTVASVRVASGAPRTTCLIVALIVSGPLVLASGWTADWTLSCVWAACVFLACGGVLGLIALSAVLTNLVLEVFSVPDWSVDTLSLLVTMPLLTVFAIYIPIRLAVVSDGLVVTREEVARLRVDEERYRISRDLHDILGRTLVAVSLREQAVLRLLELGSTDDATAQLRASSAIVAEGQATLRSLTHGPTSVDLHVELRSAQELCERVGIAWESHVDGVGDTETQHLAAAIVREAVTNMLKYSRPRRCWVRVSEDDETLELSIANDGCPVDPPTNTRGTGLRHLRARCEARGAVLEAGSPEPGTFRVLARFPVYSDRSGELT